MGYNPFAEMYDATANDFRNAEGLNRFIGTATAPFTGNFRPRLQAEGNEQPQRGLPAPAQQGPSPTEKPPAAAPQPPAGGLSTAGGADDIRGWAMRNNPNPKAYQAPQGLPTSSNDTYGQMARMLAG